MSITFKYTWNKNQSLYHALHGPPVWSHSFHPPPCSPCSWPSTLLWTGHAHAFFSPFASAMSPPLRRMLAPFQHSDLQQNVSSSEKPVPTTLSKLLQSPCFKPYSHCILFMVPITTLNYLSGYLLRVFFFPHLNGCSMTAEALFNFSQLHPYELD